MVRRGGAQPGDRLLVSGHIGDGWLGLKAACGEIGDPTGELARRYRLPQPRLDLRRTVLDHASAAADVSDGLIADAGHIAEDSGVAIDVRTDAFELAEPMRAVGSALGVDPMEFVLGGGDDHALLATFPEGSVPEGWSVIGAVSEPGPDGPAVTVDGAPYEGPTGWVHF